MNILNRLKKLETTERVNESLYIFMWDIGDIKRIKAGENVILRNDAETEEGFIYRAESELLKIDKPKDKMISAWADYSTF